MENCRIVESTGRSQASKGRRHDDKLNYYYAGQRIQEKRIRVLEKKLANVTKILLRRIEQVSDNHQDDTNLLFFDSTCYKWVSELVGQQIMMVTKRVLLSSVDRRRLMGGQYEMMMPIMLWQPVSPIHLFQLINQSRFIQVTIHVEGFGYSHYYLIYSCLHGTSVCFRSFDSVSC